MITILLSLLLSAPPSDSSVGSKSPVKARQTMQTLGQCFATEYDLQVRSLLAGDFREKAYGRDMRRLLSKPANCGAYSFPRGGFGAVESGTLLWGGALSEGLLRRDNTLDNLVAHTAYRADKPTVEARNAGELMAFCVVRNDGAAAARLLQTKVATAEELDALKALSGALSGCVPQGSQSKFTREALRALIATGAYRLAMHNQGQSQ